MINPDLQRPKEAWNNGNAYDAYMGRWSRLVAPAFLGWLAVPSHSRWLDVGCGTGALTQSILQLMDPAAVTAIDHSPYYVAFAREQVRDDRVQFDQGDAQALPVESGAYDAAVSGLMLNFVPQPSVVLAEMVRATRTGGVVALYVWDYAGQMQFTRCFWDAATALNPAAQVLDQGRRFPICHPTALLEHFQRAGLTDVGTCALDVQTTFKDFDDYWLPMLGGQGAIPTYVSSLGEADHLALRERLSAMLPTAADGSISLNARAWAVRGIC
jgi:SAM-dependent methyltransferase